MNERRNSITKRERHYAAHIHDWLLQNCQPISYGGARLVNKHVGHVSVEVFFIFD